MAKRKAPAKVSHYVVLTIEPKCNDIPDHITNRSKPMTEAQIKLWIEGRFANDAYGNLKVSEVINEERKG